MANGWGGARAGAGGRFKNKSGGALPANPSGKVPALVTVPAEPKRRRNRIDIERLLELSKQYATVNKKRPDAPQFNPFQLPAFPPSAIPKDSQVRMAMDDSLQWGGGQWAGNIFDQLAADGLQFLGYPFLSELAQRAEYRTASETIADDSTRKWVDFEITGDDTEQDDQRRRSENDPDGEAERMADPDERKKRVEAAGKADKVKELKDDQERLEVRDRFYTLVRDDGLFGRDHLFLNFGDDVDGDPKELQVPIGDGRDARSKGKIEKGSLQSLKNIEPMWAYPTTYNANNPLKDDWYNPQVWAVMGTEIHASRILSFVARPVPDILKPAYAFGGIALSQMIRPYVDDWLKTKKSVTELVHAFSVMVLSTDLMAMLEDADSGDAIARAMAFTALRDNQGLMMLNKATEDFKNVSAPISGLDTLQAQAQEHIASIVRVPLVKYTGLQPHGLNASSEGEIQVYDDTISAFQNRCIRQPLVRVINFEQLSLWGEIDPQITIVFEPLRQLTEKERGENQKAEAERDQIYVDIGVISPEEVRKKVANDRELPYADLDPEDTPDLSAEEAEGLNPKKPPGQGSEGGEGGGQDAAIIPFAEGAEKKTLFLRRPLKNAAEFIAWARAAGFKTTLPAADIHVTIAFSKEPVDWDAVPDARATLAVAAGNDRSVEPLGDKGAVVLRFDSDELQQRWRELRDLAGASWDYPTYQPHVTITYDGGDVDLSGVEPYRGPLVFGSEEGSEIKEKWFEKARDSLVSDAEWNESDHPRAPDGEFGIGGGAASSKANAPKLTPTEKSYLSSYSGDDFLRLNNELRNGKDSDPAVQKLDSAIAKAIVPAGSKLYRGMSKDAFKKLIGGEDIKVGQVLSDKGFTSTSSDPFIASMNGIGGVMMRIDVGEGQPGLDLTGISSNEHEAETLLPRGTKLKIVGIKAPKGPGAPIIVRVTTDG